MLQVITGGKMPISVLMPALSPTMKEGKLTNWLKKEGDIIESGDALCEIETDKATMEVEAVDDGILGKIIVSEGSEGVEVNTTIAIILEEGEKAENLQKVISASSLASELNTEMKNKSEQSFNDLSISKSERVYASPLARRIADQVGIDLSSLTGSGPNSRIIKQDVENAVAASNSSLANNENSLPSVHKKLDNFVEEPNSTVRNVIASRLQISKQTIPHFYLTIDCKIDELLDMRKKLNNSPQAGEKKYKITINDIVVRAVALALRKVPKVNSMWTKKAIRILNDVDISIAVDTPNGLITPIVRSADDKGLAEISEEVKELAYRAREGKLRPEEFQGGGFTISNLGMYGVKNFAAIINPPQSCILAVGAAEERPVAVNGEVVVASIMNLTLSVDHRSVDGAVGAEFLGIVKRLIEDPLTMLL